MATQICPKCSKDTFHWKVDEEESLLTVWHCNNCHYQAFENESDEQNCSNCGKRTASKLRDDTIAYCWCSSCTTLEVTKG